MRQRGSAGRGAGAAGRKRRIPPGTARAAPGAAPGSGGLDAHVLILPFVFSFVVLSFCNPETLEGEPSASSSSSPDCGRPWGAGTVPFCARDTAGKPRDSTSPLWFGISPRQPCSPAGSVRQHRGVPEPGATPGSQSQEQHRGMRRRRMLREGAKMQTTVQGGSWQTQFTTTTIIIIIIILIFL